MQLPEFATNALGRLAFEFARVQPFIPTYLHLVASAIFPIYTGAHSSLSRPASAAKREKAKKKDHLDDESDDEDEDDEPLRMEGLSSRDAIIFPVLAGCTLTGLYFLIKWLQDPALLNKILNWYFALFSVFSIARLVSDGLDVLHSIIFPHDYIDRGVLYRVRPKVKQAIPAMPGAPPRSSPLPGVFSRFPLSNRITDLLWIFHVLPSRKAHLAAHVKPLVDLKVSLGLHGFAGLLLGIGVVFWYNFISKPWFLTNIMGFGFAYGTLQILSPTTFWTGSLILCGLFCYDIYFVFYTPMMVTVAKSLDIPVKLLFPRPSEPEPEPKLEPKPIIPEPPKQSLSMLGLGDVVLPGIIIGLALRFDLFLFYLKKQTKSNPRTPKSSPRKSRSADSPSSNTSTPRSRSRSKARKSKSAEDTAAPDVIKVSYQSVAEGWGDRFWTSALLRRVSQQTSPSYTARNAFPKPYFHASLAGYIIGMLVTLGAMQITDHPQPALLYLVPGVLISLWGTGWWKGELKVMWEFSDVIEEEEEEKQKEDKKDSDEKSAAGSDEQQKDAEQKPDDGADSSVADRTRSRTQSSFFSAKRGEARAKRLSNALSGRSESKREDADSQEENEPEEQQDAERKIKRRSPKSKSKQRQKWFSFSLELPSLSPTSLKSRSGRRGKSSVTDDEAAQRQRYSLRSTDSKKGEHAVKRQRLT